MKRDDDRGSATIWVLAVSALAGVVGAAAALMAAGFVEHRHASAAADLSALAGAASSVDSEQLACLAAEQIAAANHAKLVSCAVDGRSVLVTVAVDPGPPLLPTMRISARAGRELPDLPFPQPR
ncbi:MAG: Rv3654c family TadE-like protein [Candidatus Nanopelagicales bacterium]